ncbi:host specificity factor TipJ family phage tail protein [Paracoccus sp. ME4]|uniref:host specificity factor TipJ family phage tail protein n=1 Tax=Paracoccus sp. ME4 TaxID=3138066 RepID=UPI00398B497F
MTPDIPVLAAPHFDPGAGRIEMQCSAGMSIAEILDSTLPAIASTERRNCRVMLVTDRGAEVIPEALWGRVRPRPGVRVVVRVIAGKGAVKAVLSIAIAVAAFAIGTMFGAPFAAALGLSGKFGVAIGTALLSTGVTLVGNLLLSALIPPVKPESRDVQARYSIAGWQNRLDPDGAVPVVMGRHRYAPPFACFSHSEIVGDEQYIRAVFCLGEGPLQISDLRIGETSIDEYEDVQVEVRDGRATDLPQTIITRQILEEAVGVELVRPLPRDSAGEVTPGGGEEKPVVRTTGGDAQGASIILSFPGGLVRFNDEGDQRHESVSVKVEQRRIDAEEWQLVTTLGIRAKKLEMFYRQHSWTFPTRGRWQIRLTMMTDETTDSKVQRRATWAALQTRRPEYPLNYRRPLALVAIRARATHQLSGNLDSFNAIAQALCLDYDHTSGQWVERATSNPAALFRHALQSPSNPRPATMAELDLDQLQDWHDFCRIKGLQYDRVLDQAGTTMREILTEIAVAGRASPRHDGLKWGVVIDRPAELVVDHVGPRNSWSFSTTRTYVRPPHAFRVKFLDRTNDWKPAERLVRWPGYGGPIIETEALEMPGKTDPAEVWREARRRMYEVIHRPDRHQVTQDGPARVATRGDTVALSHRILDKVQTATRVRAVAGAQIHLEDPVTLSPGDSHAIRFRVFSGPEDSIGTSVVRPVAAEPGETDVLLLDGSGPAPQAGDPVYFGRESLETFSCVVTGVEAAQDMASILHLVDAAPQIDSLLEQDTIPAWSGRVGAEVNESLLAPAAPRFTSITSEPTIAGSVSYLIEPGPSPVSAGAFSIEHRPEGAGTWTVDQIPAANGGGVITGYANGASIQMRARAISSAGVSGAYGATIPLIVGARGTQIPVALDPEATRISTRLGGAIVEVATGSDPATERLQLYRSPTPVLDRNLHRVGTPVTVQPLQTVSIPVGDTSRQSLLTGTWTLDSGWTRSGDTLFHTAGSTGVASQPVTTISGRWYRVGLRVADRSDGNLSPRLSGGTLVTGPVLNSNGRQSARLQAVEGNTSFQLFAGSLFDGAVSEIACYLETAATLDAGLHYLWVEPQNRDGVPGPVAGPFVIDVI